MRSTSITTDAALGGGDAIGEASIGSSASCASAAGASTAESTIDDDSDAASRDDRRESGREARPSREAALERGGGDTGEMPRPSGQPVTLASAAAALLGVFAREYGCATSRTTDVGCDALVATVVLDERAEVAG